MGLIQWAEQKTKALSIWDIWVLKTYCILFGIIIGAYLSTYVREHVWWFVAGVIVCGAVLGYRWFTAGAQRA